MNTYMVGGVGRVRDIGRRQKAVICVWHDLVAKSF